MINMNSSLKEKIEQSLSEMNLESADYYIAEYKKQNPYDRDLWFYECVYSLLVNDIVKAQNIADKCVRRFPTSYEAYYYQASVYQARGMVQEALKGYRTAAFLYKFLGCNNVPIWDDTNAQIEILEDEYEKILDGYISNNDVSNMMRARSYFARKKTVWGKCEVAPRNDECLIVGTEFWVTDDDLRYVGMYRAPLPMMVGEENMSLVRTQAEFLKFKEKGKRLIVSGDVKEYLLPIASVEDKNLYSFADVETKHISNIPQMFAKHFNYYKIKNNTTVQGRGDAYFGYPIPLEHKRDRRKLVISFFVDGLAQEIINGPDFKELMPNTYEFFSKGTICTQTYSCSEWTFPSLATYESGLNTLNHMMFHNKLDGELPHDVPTLSEYFKSKGYYTSKLDGDWRCIYSYGFARGVDQYVYHIQSMGARAEQEIINIIEHIETFKDTDHYLWMTVGDLHDIADGLDLSPAVQKELTLEERESEEIGETSVKQKSSWRKSSMYKKTAHYFDMLFGLLYTYIQNNFSDDEILISLFADHGQGYLVPPDAHFLAKERSKVAFMFRGKGVPNEVTDEIMSTADYVPIMCKLAGIDMKADAHIDGRLPKVFGGEKARDYAITESLHPGDVYSAVANSTDYEIYFDNSEKTDEEGRFRLGEYKVYGFNKTDGSPVEDTALLKEYEAMFLDRIREHISYE